jgi:hypothetical protein
MLAVPTEPGGVVHVIDVAENTTTSVHAAPPTVTAETPVKVPVIVIAVPPAVEPDVGDTAVTVSDAPGPICDSDDAALMLEPDGE